MNERREISGLGRPYAGESKGDRIDRRRQQFLQAALDVFGTTGYRTATVRRLCSQAALTDRYFYESFAGLEDLLMAVYQEQTDRLKAVLLDSVSGMNPNVTPLQMVEGCLHALFKEVADPRVARLCWLEILGVSARVDALYTATLGNFATLLLSLARLHSSDWALPEDQEHLLSVALVGAVSQSIQNWLLTNYQAPIESVVTATLLVFEGVLKVLNSRAGDREVDARTH